MLALWLKEFTSFRSKGCYDKRKKGKKQRSTRRKIRDFHRVVQLIGKENQKYQKGNNKEAVS